MSDLVDQFARLATAEVVQALSRLGMSGRCVGLVPAHRAGAKLYGRAFTVKFLPCGAPDGRVPVNDLSNYLADVPAGYVLALDNRRDDETPIWSEGLTALARQRGIAGTVMDGACGSTEADSASPYPIFARRCQAASSARQVRVEAVNLPIAIGGVRVECDDLIHADGTELVVVPRDHLLSVLAEVQRPANGSGRRP